MSTPRSYSTSVQVMLFADRLEVMNSGRLPPALTVEKLRVPHQCTAVPHVRFRLGIDRIERRIYTILDLRQWIERSSGN